MSKEFEPQVVLPTFYRAANECMFFLMVCGASLVDASHRDAVAKLAKELDLEFKAITKLAQNGEGSKN